MRRLIDHDHFTGVSTYYESVDGRTLIYSEQDIEPIIEENKIMFNDDDYKKRGMKNDFLHVARIPNIVLMKWLNSGFDPYKATAKELLKKLNDPEYAYLKVASGRYA